MPTKPTIDPPPAELSRIPVFIDAQTAEYLGLTVAQLKNLRRSGKGPPYSRPRGGRVWSLRKSVDEWALTDEAPDEIRRRLFLDDDDEEPDAMAKKKSRKNKSRRRKPYLRWFVPKYMTTDEFAELLQVSPQTLEMWRREGDGPPFFKRGGIVRYPRDPSFEWLRAHEVRSTSEGV